jgi:hypothetical protein
LVKTPIAARLTKKERGSVSSGTGSPFVLLLALARLSYSASKEMKNSRSYFGSGEARACLRARTESAYKRINSAKSPLPKSDLFNLIMKKSAAAVFAAKPKLAAQDGTIGAILLGALGKSAPGKKARRDISSPAGTPALRPE